MPQELPPRVTRLLVAWSKGDRGALDELMPLVCDELRRMARRYMDGESSHTFQPTELVQEFFLRLKGRRTVKFDNHKHFFGFAGQEMRLILVDRARRQKRQKRGSGEAPISLDSQHEQLPVAGTDLDVLAIHEVLDRLEAIDRRAAEVVKLRFFVGMTVPETAAALETSPATVKRDWEFARLWLFRELNGGTRTPEEEPGGAGNAE